MLGRLLPALILLLAVPAHAEDPAAEAQAFTTAAGERIRAITGSETLTPEVKRVLVEEVVESSLDLSYMTRVALGPSADAFSRDELVEFVPEFEQYLLNVYVRWVARRKGGATPLGASYDTRTDVARVEFRSPERAAAGYAYPRRRPDHPGIEVWRLRRRYGEWRILAIVIDGVDLAKSFREQFASVLERSTPADLLAELRRRNAEAQAENPFS